jgi:hypothetical protein
VDDIKDGGARSFAYLDKRIALFRTPGGIFASDTDRSRCAVPGKPEKGAVRIPVDARGDHDPAWSAEARVRQGQARVRLRTRPSSIGR